MGLDPKERRLFAERSTAMPSGTERRTWTALIELFADDPDVLLIATGADERRVGRPEGRQFERNFAEAERTRFEWISRHVAAAGDAAWVAADAIVHVTVDGAERSIPIRFTVVLEQRDGAWVWLHRHASVAAGGQPSGAAYPEETETD